MLNTNYSTRVTPRILHSGYAIFRADIQQYIIKQILPHHSSILDPMAGTAPLIPILETQGYTSYINDILPVYFFINQAKQYSVFQRYQKYGKEWFLKELLSCMRFLKKRRLCISNEWIEKGILNGLINSWESTNKYEKNISILLKAVIINSIRAFSSVTKSDNPTWLKNGGISSGRRLEEIVEESLIAFIKYYSVYDDSRIVTTKKGKCIFSAQNANKIKLKNKVDLIITSPPYCNRLDTMRQYAPELYFLSKVGYSVRLENMIANNKISTYTNFKADFEYLTSKSKYAEFLLNRIKKLPPKYYIKYYTRYFSVLCEVLQNVVKNLSSKGKMYIIVQDNTHKGNLIEIDEIIKEVLMSDGWYSRIIEKWERHHLGLRNPSQKHAYVKRKQLEKLILIER